MKMEFYLHQVGFDLEYLDYLAILELDLRRGICGVPQRPSHIFIAVQGVVCSLPNFGE